MAREASTAPKERINVTFKPATGGAVEEIELPLKVTVLGDFRQTHDERNLIDRKPVGINKNSFADVMEKQNLSLELTVPNRLQQDDQDRELNAKLKFASMRDFEPGSIVEQIPELAAMNRLRQALVTLKGPLGNLPTFRKALEEIIKDSSKRNELLAELQAAGVDVNSFKEEASSNAPLSGDVTGDNQKK